MDLDTGLIDAMFAKHGVAGAWEVLPSTGLANRIFATATVVLRVATDHPDGVPDARTESVAAPVARAAGIVTPRLIAFDDTRTLVNRPFSLWDRVCGETLGSIRLPRERTAHVWREVGRELARLHTRVHECADPDGYLDDPARDQDIDAAIEGLMEGQQLSTAAAARLRRLIEELRPYSVTSPEARFIHGDIHPMNVMCSASGDLLAIIDWGDAGWGDPVLDFVGMPAEAIGPALEGYEGEAPGLLDERARGRIAWNSLSDAVQDAREAPGSAPDVAGIEHVVRSTLKQR